MITIRCGNFVAIDSETPGALDTLLSTYFPSGINPGFTPGSSVYTLTYFMTPSSIDLTGNFVYSPFDPLQLLSSSTLNGIAYYWETRATGARQLIVSISDLPSLTFDQLLAANIDDIYAPFVAAGLNIEGGTFGDTLGGDFGNDIINGNRGNDTLFGYAGNDVLIGGANTLAPSIGTAYTPAGAIGTNWNIIGAGDVSGDAKADYIWTNAGQIAIWTIANGVLTGGAVIDAAIGSDWTAKAVGDFNHDGLSDVLWVNAGRVAVWELNGANVINGGVSNGQIGANFSFRAVGDFNGDGYSDVLWHSDTGQVAMWMMKDASIVSGGLTSAAIGTEWAIGGSGDFNGDGKDDLVWYNASGQAAIWLMNDTTVSLGQLLLGDLTGTTGAGWKIAGVTDINMDGKADIVWYDPANNAVETWYMDGTNIVGSTHLSTGGQIGTDWKLAGLGDVTGDGRPDIVWTRPNGSSVIWDLQGNGDKMTGGVGRDTFQFNSLNEMGKVITDFQAGNGGDVLSIHNLLVSIGYVGTDPLHDGEIRLIQDGAKTELQVDSHPGAHHYVTAATLESVVATQVTTDNFLL